LWRDVVGDLDWEEYLNGYATSYREWEERSRSATRSGKPVGNRGVRSQTGVDGGRIFGTARPRTPASRDALKGGWRVRASTIIEAVSVPRGFTESETIEVIEST